MASTGSAGRNLLPLPASRAHLGIDSDVDITQRDIVNAQAAIPQAAQLDAEMELAGRHRYARLFEALNVL